MPTFSQIKDIAELLSFLCAPVILFFAWKMLDQLKIGGEQVKAALDQIITSKKISQIQSKRESIKIAAEQSVLYAKEIIPEMDKFIKLQKQNKYPILSRATVIESIDGGMNIQCQTDDLPGLNKEVLSNDGLVIKTLNKLEGLAMYFVCGVADANAAYRPLVSTFCNYIKTFLPYIVIANEQYRQYSNILVLYCAWKVRVEAEHSAQEIEKHKQHLSKIKVPELKPHGTQENC